MFFFYSKPITLQMLTRFPQATQNQEHQVEFVSNFVCLNLCYKLSFGWIFSNYYKFTIVYNYYNV